MGVRGDGEGKSAAGIPLGVERHFFACERELFLGSLKDPAVLIRGVPGEGFENDRERFTRRDRDGIGLLPDPLTQRAILDSPMTVGVVQDSHFDR